MTAPRLHRDYSATSESPVGTRLQRRAVLDCSIDEEVVRGDLRGAVLADDLEATLALVVEHELRQEEALSEEMLLAAAPVGRFFGARRHRQRLGVLEAMNLVRRDGGSVHATVAGISAIVRPSLLTGVRMPRDLLRVLRQAELTASKG